MRNRSTVIRMQADISLADLRSTIGSRMTLANHCQLSFVSPKNMTKRKALLSEADWLQCRSEVGNGNEVEIVVSDLGEIVLTSGDAEEWIVVDSAIEDEEYFRALGSEIWKRVIGYSEKRISDEKLRQDSIPRKQFKEQLAKSLQEIQGGLAGFKAQVYSDLKDLKSQLKLQRLICLMELKSKSEPSSATGVMTIKDAPIIAESQKKFIHHGVACDQCRVSPIVGVRFKSIHKRNYDLCDNCHSKIENRMDVYIALRECHPSRANHLVHLSRAIVKPGQISSELNLLQHLHQWTDEFVDLSSMS